MTIDKSQCKLKYCNIKPIW